MKRKYTLLALVPVAAVALAACGGDDASIGIDGAWARNSPMASDRGAVYFEITAEEADTLVAASVDSSIAGTVEIHEMVMMEMDGEMGDMDGEMGDMDHGDDGEMGDMDEMSDEMGSDMEMDDMEMDGEMGAEPMMAMQEMAAGLPLPAGEMVELKPGSYHVMLLDLVEPLEIGDEFEVTLSFADSDDITLDVPVLETAP